MKGAWTDEEVNHLEALLERATPGADDPDACETLKGLLDDREFGSLRFGLRVIFRRDPLAAYERLAPFVTAQDVTSTKIGDETLSLLAPSAFSWDGTAHWHEADMPAWLAQDPRWFKLCAELTQDERHGDSARAILCHADRDIVLPALETARAKREPPRPPATRAMGNLPARYRAGDHLGTWRNARGFGAIGGDLRAEIAALADETMSRVARNVDLISERLQREGWRTLAPMRTLPEPADEGRIASIEQMTGAPLPPSLASFWRIVGGMCWAWDYDRLEGPVIGGLSLAHIDTDALWIEPCASIEPLCFEEWEEQKNAFHPDLVGPFRLDLSPDNLHKMNVSGGPPYAIELPCHGADPRFKQEDRNLNFVDYLRDCFAWAGFPNLVQHGDRAAVSRFIDHLGEGLEPF